MSGKRTAEMNNKGNAIRAGSVSNMGRKLDVL